MHLLSKRIIAQSKTKLKSPKDDHNDVTTRLRLVCKITRSDTHVHIHTHTHTHTSQVSTYTYTHNNCPTVLDVELNTSCLFFDQENFLVILN